MALSELQGKAKILTKLITKYCNKRTKKKEKKKREMKFSVVERTDLIFQYCCLS